MRKVLRAPSFQELSSKEVKKPNNVVSGTTCFAVHQKHNVPCQKRGCRNWILSPEDSCNCVLIAAQDGQHTFEGIADLLQHSYGKHVSRAAVYQTLDRVLNELKDCLIEDIKNFAHEIETKTEHS